LVNHIQQVQQVLGSSAPPRVVRAMVRVRVRVRVIRVRVRVRVRVTASSRSSMSWAAAPHLGLLGLGL
jgi:hypothetical protein